MYKIFIAENIPSLNKGEMAILEGMRESFKTLGETEVSMLSSTPDVDQACYGARIKIIDAKKALHLFGNPKGYNKVSKIFASTFVIIQHLSFLIIYKILGLSSLKFMKSEIWKEYAESNVILVGHNGTFGITGGLGVLSFFSYLYMPFLGKILGKPLVIYGGTIGPLRQFRRFFWRGAKFVLKKMDLITLRENASYQNLKDMGLQTNYISVTADLAFLLQPTHEERLTEIMRQEGIEKSSEPLIGITITREIASRAIPELDNPGRAYRKHIEMFAEVIDNLMDTLGATVIFIPHCIGFGEKLDDRIAAEDIFIRCENKERVKVLTNEYSAAELKGLIGQLDFFIGERVHSIIGAMSMEVPSIVISYSSDQRLGIIRMLGQDDAICYVENLNSEALLSKVYDSWSMRDKIKEELKSQTEIMRRRAMLNGKLLKELIDSRKSMDRT
jgi:polysaccharide pyruvyl transferase WcaK-like protein